MAAKAEKLNMINRVKVSFPINSELGANEYLYAQPCGENKYIVDNSPFYVFDISFCDVISVVRDGEDLIFGKVLERGGHSTYRIKLPKGKDHKYFISLWGELERLGCTFEGSSINEQRLYSIDIPQNTDVTKVYAILESNEEKLLWEFEEGHYFNGTKSSLN